MTSMYENFVVGSLAKAFEKPIDDFGRSIAVLALQDNPDEGLHPQNKQRPPPTPAPMFSGEVVGEGVPVKDTAKYSGIFQYKVALVRLEPTAPLKTLTLFTQAVLKNADQIDFPKGDPKGDNVSANPAQLYVDKADVIVNELAMRCASQKPRLVVTSFIPNHVPR